jgi:hypothetical protein
VLSPRIGLERYRFEIRMLGASLSDSLSEAPADFVRLFSSGRVVDSIIEARRGLSGDLFSR